MIILPPPIQKNDINFQLLWRAEFLSQPHGILQDKIGAYLLHGTSFRIDLHFFFYKHLVYKHAQPQILGNFKHIAKHAPGWDFRFKKKILVNFPKNMPIFRHFLLEFHKNQWKLWQKLKWSIISICQYIQDFDTDRNNLISNNI